MREHANKTKQLVRAIQGSGRNRENGFVDNRMNSVFMLQSNVNKTIQMASFFIGDKRYRTEEYTVKELSDLIDSLKSDNNIDAISSLKEALINDLKRNAGYKILIDKIDGVGVEEPLHLTTTETKGMIESHPFKRKAEDIKILQNKEIDIWIHNDTPLPESNVKAEIAEQLTEHILLRYIEEKGTEDKVLTNVKVVKENIPPSPYQYTTIAEIDHLQVCITSERHYVPQMLVETKAGMEGNKTGHLKTQLSNKRKALLGVKHSEYKIFHNGIDITYKFDIDLFDERIGLKTSGIFEGKNDIVLNRDEINGIYNFLCVVQQHYLAYRREW